MSISYSKKWLDLTFRFCVLLKIKTHSPECILFVQSILTHHKKFWKFVHILDELKTIYFERQNFIMNKMGWDPFQCMKDQWLISVAIPFWIGINLAFIYG